MLHTAENANLREASPQSALSQRAPLLDFSTEFLSPITTEAITYLVTLFYQFRKVLWNITQD